MTRSNYELRAWQLSSTQERPERISNYLVIVQKSQILKIADR
ncbi:hypothetical protein [Komarekiella delphini-convector]|nr:hypothetical protein [Komarekiella delphini-convector]